MAHVVRREARPRSFGDRFGGDSVTDFLGLPRGLFLMFETAASLSLSSSLISGAVGLVGSGAGRALMSKGWRLYIIRSLLANTNIGGVVSSKGTILQCRVSKN